MAEDADQVDASAAASADCPPPPAQGGRGTASFGDRQPRLLLGVERPRQALAARHGAGFGGARVAPFFAKRGRRRAPAADRRRRPDTAQPDLAAQSKSSQRPGPYRTSRRRFKRRQCLEVSFT
ncbi:hypothetical protein MRX96_037830 [Rhipicephalus microplus]